MLRHAAYARHEEAAERDLTRHLPLGEHHAESADVVGRARDMT